MPKLYRTTCSTDWKGRPDHGLSLLGEGTREELLKVMDADVARWQANDIVCRNEGDEIDAEEEGRPPCPISTWGGDLQWEMERQNPDNPRQFAERYEDGGFFSMVYHIVD